MRDDYRYVLELFRPDGEALGQAALTPDWEPAVECARFAGLRSFGVWATEPAAERIEPVWQTDLGQPYVEKFRVQFVAAPVGDSDASGAREWFEDFPATRYFADAARGAAAQLVESGALKKGDNLVYRPAAFARADPAATPAPFQFEAADAPPPLPLQRAALAGFLAKSTPHGDPDDRDAEVVVPQHVVDEASALTTDAGARETGGILIGHLHQDPLEQEVFIEVTAQIPARHTQGDAVKLTFTSDTWTDVRNTIALRRKQELMLGWWHSHPAREWCKECPPERQRACRLATGFLSSDDKALHRAMFPRAFSVALVMTHSLDGVSAALFGWRSGLLEPRGFRMLAAAQGGHHAIAATEK